MIFSANEVFVDVVNGDVSSSERCEEAAMYKIHPSCSASRRWCNISTYG
jgi:hypothetical protein